jgi:endogenous inhibitor of DNA gyrase (YacG/DUF329 family)
MRHAEHDAREERDGAPDEGGPPRCPICDAPSGADEGAFPFCSRRCRMIDLGRWLGGRYVVSRPMSEEDLTDHG